jgi:2-polyprenyl-3-methyl-5-hydroxy-6-metoxy-1,4-benzoquinol methylase
MTQTNIPEEEITNHCLSLADEMGQVFRWQGRLLREIPPPQVEAFQRFWESGLPAELQAAELVPKTYITEFQTQRGGLVLEHEQVPIVTYPCEWTFGMVRAAGQLVLQVNERARRYGYQLKDAHGYNVVFDGGRPLYVDFGSFTPIRAGATGWIGEEEFRQFYLHPLRLWSAAGPDIARRLLMGDICINDYAAFRLGSRIGSLLPRYIAKKILHLRRLVWLSSVASDDKLISRAGKFATLWRRHQLPPYRGQPEKRLERALSAIRPWHESTLWTGYHQPMRESGCSPRIRTILERVQDLAPSRIMDVGCNEGEVALRLREAPRPAHMVAMDADPNAIEVLFQQIRGRRLGVTPVLSDLMLPLSPAVGESQETRFKSDVVIALALTHHLTLTQRQPIEIVMKKLASFSSRHLLVEFMPLGLWDGNSALPLPSWYTQEWFHKAFSNYCTDIQVDPLETNRVLFQGRVKNLRKQ